ncbi:hypothetical protein [Nostoc favosum]|uniref:Lipoprotein n=1 Tax=Nostoc favosum CHAB5714 TaxID=2780399 RepID=A0ABS8IKN0_9NOSO|nr:hypothetical protein [Nostoc favosum]MCC5604802.1 hypothetical protein [Nostoc favosum CHAB5714]
MLETSAAAPVTPSAPARPAAVVRVLAPLAGLALLSGCMTAKLDENRMMPTAITADEGIVILAKPQVEGTGAEEDFMGCVGEKLAKGERPMKVFANQRFQDQLYPWFEPSTAPVRAEGVTSLLNRPKVATRLAETGVRYVVWVDGNTRRTDGGGSIACGAAPGAAGCIGFGWWEKQSDYVATVWDLKTAKSAGSVSTNITGTSAMVGLVVPLPFIARVQGTACDRLAGQLRGFLQGADPSALPGAGGGGH